MSTRRNVTGEQGTQLRAASSDSSQPADIAPAVPAPVIYKLLAFTIAMITVPIGSYFATVNVVFRGNSTYAGGLAAVVANVILIAYVVVAMKEDQSERMEAEEQVKSHNE